MEFTGNSSRAAAGRGAGAVKEWVRAAETVAAEPGATLLLGAASTGKTTCAALLANCCLERGLKVALVDADVGQSDIGPPGTIGMGLVTAPLERMRDVRLTAAYFVGSNSPAGHLHHMVVGTRLMVDRAREVGAEAVIVDTTGAVHGWFARDLKQAKIDAVRPRYVIGLQALGEIEHLLGPMEHCPWIEVIRLPVSPRARTRSRDERRRFRERAFREHLSPGMPVELGYRKTPFFRTFLGKGRRLDAGRRAELAAALGYPVAHAEAVPGGLFVVGPWEREPDPAAARDIALSESGEPGFVHLSRETSYRSLLVGILDTRGEFMAEGILEAVDFEREVALILSPLDEERASRIGAVVLGTLRVSGQGTEIGRISSSDV